MRAKPLSFKDGEYRLCLADEATHIQIHVPGPFPDRILPVNHKDTAGQPNWTWDMNVDDPTLSPSIRTRTPDAVCHSFVKNGRIQFLDDCTHEHAGQTLDLLEVEP